MGVGVGVGSRALNISGKCTGGLNSGGCVRVGVIVEVKVASCSIRAIEVEDGVGVVRSLFEMYAELVGEVAKTEEVPAANRMRIRIMPRIEVIRNVRMRLRLARSLWVVFYLNSGFNYIRSELDNRRELLYLA